MANLFDYLLWRGDLDFERVPLCDVDNLILSLICFIDLQKFIPNVPFEETAVSLEAVAKKYFADADTKKDTMGLIVPKDIIKLFREAVKCKRFAKVRVCGFENQISEKEQKQFSASTYLLGDNTMYVAFRGTDDTIVGWKENFNMSFKMPVPSQTEALRYLLEVAQNIPDRKIYVGGHSKGGNLAIFSAMNSTDDVERRIVRVYNNDGPGFMDEGYLNNHDYLRIKSRTKTIIPKSSVVGILLNHSDEYTVVKSSASGMFQHDGLSWEVLGDSFITLESLSKDAVKRDKTLKKWLAGLTSEQKEQFCDALYGVLTSTNATTLSELASSKTELFKQYKSLDPETKAVLKETVKALFTVWGKTALKLDEPKKNTKQK